MLAASLQSGAIIVSLDIGTIKENQMDKKYGYYVFGGLLLGAVFGSLWAADGNTLFGIALGVLENKSGKK